MVAAAAGLVLLLASTVTADLLVSARVKDRLTGALRCVSGDDSLDPDISLGRTPVLLQLVTGEISTIHITGLSAQALRSSTADPTDRTDLTDLTDQDETAGSGDSAASGGELLDAADLALTLHHVSPGTPVSIGSAVASATVGWDALTDRLTSTTADLDGAELGADDGMIAVTLARQVMGQSLEVLMSVAVEDSALELTPQTVVIGQRRIQASLLSGLVGGLGNGDQNPLEARTVDLDLPDGATLRSAEVGSDGLTVDLAMSADDLGDASGGSDCLG